MNINDINKRIDEAKKKINDTFDSINNPECTIDDIASMMLGNPPPKSRVQSAKDKISGAVKYVKDEAVDTGKAIAHDFTEFSMDYPSVSGVLLATTTLLFLDLDDVI